MAYSQTDSTHRQTLLTALSVAYANVAMYAAAFMAQSPVLPYLTESLGASTAQFGLFQTLFSAIQFIGTIISGPLLDMYGGRPLLLVSLIASALCYGLTASSTTLTMLYMSRLPTVFQHAMLAAKAIVTDSSTEEGRAVALSYIGVGYGVGFGIGPIAGGYLSNVSLTFASWVATLVSLFGCLTVVLFIPNSPKVKSKKEIEVKAESIVSQYKNLLSSPDMRNLLTIKVIGSMASAVFQSMFSVILKESGLGPQSNGMALSMLGVMTIASQALLVGPASRRMGEARAVYLCLWVQCASFMALAGCLAASLSVFHLLAALVPLVASSTVYASLNTAMLTKASPLNQRGTVLSIDMSIFSAVRMVSPTLGAWLLTSYGPASIGLTAAACVGLILVLIHTGVLWCKDAHLIEVVGEEVAEEKKKDQ